jgi:hypothetical protein
MWIVQPMEWSELIISIVLLCIIGVGGYAIYRCNVNNNEGPDQ